MHKCHITEKILKLEQENAALIIQIEELTTQQVDRDKLLDEFGIAIDARISEWKVLNINLVCVFLENVYMNLYDLCYIRVYWMKKIWR